MWEVRQKRGFKMPPPKPISCFNDQVNNFAILQASVPRRRRYYQTYLFFFASTYFFLRLGIIPKLSALDLTLKQEISPPRLFVILLNCSVERREVRLKLFIFIKVTILLMFAHLQSLSVLGIVIIPKNSVGSWHTLQYFWVPVWVAKYLKSNV